MSSPDTSKYCSELEAEFPGWAFKHGKDHEIIVTNTQDGRTGSVKTWYENHQATAPNGAIMNTRLGMDAFAHVTGQRPLSEPVLLELTRGPDRATARFTTQRGMLFEFYSPNDITRVETNGKWMSVTAKDDSLKFHCASERHAASFAANTVAWVEGYRESTGDVTPCEPAPRPPVAPTAKTR